MKVILSFAILFFSLSAFAQYDSSKILQVQNVYGYEWKNAKVKGPLGLSTDTVKMAVKDSNFIVLKGSSVYKWNGYKWISVGGGSGGSGGTTYTGQAPIVVTGSSISADTAKAPGKLATFTDVKIVESQGVANAASIQQRIDSLRNNGGTLEARKGGVFVPQFVLPSGGGGDFVQKVAALTDTRVPFVAGGGKLTDNANFSYNPTEKSLRFGFDGVSDFLSSVIFGDYSSIGALAGGAAFIMATGAKPNSAVANTLVKLNNGLSKASFIRNSYVSGISFHTGITGAEGSVISETSNQRMLIDNDGKLYVASLATGLTAPVTTGTTKMVITDANGLQSFTDIPGGGGSATDTTSLSNRINLKQNLVTLTTTGASGAATFNQGTGALNIPSYTGGGGASGDTVTGRYAYINGGGIFGDTAILPRTDTIINFGASVESGSAGTGVGGINKWVSYLNKDLGTTEINRALGGSPFATVAGDDSAFINRLYLIPNYRKGIRYIIIGASNFINDVGLYGTGSINTYYSTVLRAIDTLTILRGYPLNRIIFLTPNTVGVSNSATPPYNTNLTYASLKRVSDTVLLAAKSKGVVTIDVFKLTQKFITDGNIAQFLSSDSVHPTLEGHKAMANIISTFLGTLKVNNSIRVENTITVGKSADIKDYLLLGDNSVANPTSSILTANSTTKGILPPRMTTTERNAIVTPSNGLFIFNKTTGQYNYYDSIAVAWQFLTTGSISGWGLTGNPATTFGTNFLGTSDNVNLAFKVNNLLSGFIKKSNFSTSLGYEGLSAETSGEYNTNFGSNGLRNLITGQQNANFGSNGLFNNSGSFNTNIGHSGGQNNSTGSNNLFLGYASGFGNTTASNQVFINSLFRGSYALDQTESPIYIVQNATVANQKTTINGKAKISVTPEFADNAAAVAGGLVNGDIYRTGDLMKIVHP